MKPVALTIAGSDPSGGAGIQADLKTFHQFGVYGEAVITLLTVQNTTRVSRVECMSASLVIEQIAAVLEDIPPHAAKTGALGNAELIEAVARIWSNSKIPLVVDPVMISKHGAPLLAAEAQDVLRRQLLPCAMLVTPNLHEAAALTGLAVETVVDMERAAKSLLNMGPKAVLIKGGHLNGAAIDVFYDGREMLHLEAPRVETIHTHGTGCTYSAAITAGLALGHQLPAAVKNAKHYITEAIRTNPRLGSGSGPVNHHANPDGAVAGSRRD